ncbi:Uncharacterised protein [Klebsiella pneumoniae]|nr:Uncharacterised protein [Klebsiella pneumoniae]
MVPFEISVLSDSSESVIPSALAKVSRMSKTRSVGLCSVFIFFLVTARRRVLFNEPYLTTDP